MLNPLIVEGQLHGGLAQGIAAALYEELKYDQCGQLLNGSFMDYLLPSAADLPRFRLEHLVTPSPIIPGGMKGVGEAGVIAPPAAVVNAVEDALRPFGVKFTQTPLTPEVIVSALAQAEARASDAVPVSSASSLGWSQTRRPRNPLGFQVIGRFSCAVPSLPHRRVVNQTRYGWNPGWPTL